MAGTLVTSIEDKAEILQILGSMFAETSTRSFARAIDALKCLYAEQERISQAGGDAKSVDWLVFLKRGNMLDFSMFGV